MTTIIVTLKDHRTRTAEVLTSMVNAVIRAAREIYAGQIVTIETV
jgi:hypothetical protein